MASKSAQKDKLRLAGSPSGPQATQQDAVVLDYTPRTVAFKVIITAALEPSPAAFKNPSFRFTFLGGRREVTPELGVAGWKEVDLGGGRKALQFEKAFGAQPADKDLAMAINAQPVIMFTLADKMDGELASAVKPGGAAAVLAAKSAPATVNARPASGGAEKPSKGKNGAAAQPPPPPTGRNFIFTTHLDVSHLLAGESQGTVAQVHDTSDLTTPPPPHGMAYLRMEVATDKPRQPLLSSGLLHDLNPMVVHVRDVKGLPGLTCTSSSSSDVSQEGGPYHVLNRHCHPVYASARLSTASKLFPRVARTIGHPNQRHIRWDLRTVYLTGHLDRQQLHEHLFTDLLELEVHDRDALGPLERPRERQKRLERMVAGDYTFDARAGRFVEEDELPTHPDPSGLQVAPPMNVFDVDERVLKEWLEQPFQARDSSPHGLASLSLSGLLDQSKELANALARNASSQKHVCDMRPRVKGRYDVIPQKPRRKPKGGAELEECDLSAEQRMLKHEVGKYLDSGCTIGVDVILHRPLRTLKDTAAQLIGQLTPVPGLFSRAVIIFEYENSHLLLRVIAAMESVNHACLPDIVGSLRAYELTPEEKEAAKNGDLDAVCGFQLIDDDCRMVIIEGKWDGGLAEVMSQLPRERKNDEGYRILFNPCVRFTKRLYTGFNVDLKKVRLRHPLPTLMTMPEIYDRARIPVEFFDALQGLLLMRQVHRLSDAQMYRLFPSGDILMSIESRYGETITNRDIWGDGGKAGSQRASTVGAAGRTRVISGNQDDADTADNTARDDPRAETSHSRVRADRRKGSTHAFNPEFIESLRHRTATNYLELRRHQGEEVEEQYRKRKQRRLDEEDADSVPAAFQYGAQELQYVELKKAALRDVLCKRKDVTYTFSKDYLSGAFSMVDEFRMKQEQAAESKSRWLTGKGFIWPAPRTPSELNAHPQKPAQTRIDILNEPWIENELHPKPVSRAVELPPGQPDFHNYATNGNTLFGGYERPEFDRDYDSTKVGDAHRLPRGRMKLRSDPHFYSSVHLSAVKAIKLQKEAQAREKADWMSKVVVDTLDFMVAKSVTKIKPSQLDRCTDILHGKPKKGSLKKLRHLQLPSGKPIKFEPPPISALSLEPYEDRTIGSSGFRETEPEKFAGRDPVTNETLPFCSYIHKDHYKTRSDVAVSRRKHAPLTMAEKCGPKWDI